MGVPGSCQFWLVQIALLWMFVSRSFLGVRGQEPGARLPGACVLALQDAPGCFAKRPRVPFLASARPAAPRVGGRAAFCSQPFGSWCGAHSSGCL